MAKFVQDMFSKKNSLLLLWLPVFILFTMNACKTARLLWYNLPDQKDFKHFPANPIQSEPKSYFSDAHIPAIGNIPVKTKNMKRDSLPLDLFLRKEPVIAFIIAKNNQIIYEKYFDGYNQHNVLTSFSLSKSYVSALIGIAISEGYIHSVDDYITQYIPELKKNKNLEKITLKHLLEHRSGIRYQEIPFNPFGKMAHLYYSRNMRNILNRIRSKKSPGVIFEYQSINTFLLGIILENATKVKPSTFLQEKLWKPLGMEGDASWLLDRKNGTEKTFCCIQSIARNHLRLGVLYKNKGMWEEKQLIPIAWIEESLPCQPDDYNFVFPYHWQSGYCKRGDFNARGLYEQYIFVDPKTSLVIVQMCKKNYRIKFSWRDFYRELCDKIQPHLL